MNNIHYGRNKKGIRLELNKKILEWLSSIDDIPLRERVSKEVIVTGGSIASMLLGEKVNDFDIYLKTKETTKLIAEYYVAEFNKANEIKLGNVSNPDKTGKPYVTEDRIKNCKGEIEDRITIYIKSAGVVGEGQNTYHYFESQPDDITAAFVDSLNENKDTTKKKYRPVFMSANAITLSNDIQLVIRFYGEPDKIHDNFDFKHAMCYFDYNQNNLVLPGEALECLLSRTLVYVGSLYPMASIFRMKKFIERGWRINAGQQIKIMWQISDLDLKDPVTLQEQLTGCDAAYMHQLIEALKDVSPEKINSSYISEIVDRIFG
jgi:hypothetical protein